MCGYLISGQSTEGLLGLFKQNHKFQPNCSSREKVRWTNRQADIAFYLYRPHIQHGPCGHVLLFLNPEKTLCSTVWGICFWPSTICWWSSLEEFVFLSACSQARQKALALLPLPCFHFFPLGSISPLQTALCCFWPKVCCWNEGPWLRATHTLSSWLRAGFAEPAPQVSIIKCLLGSSRCFVSL